MRIIDIINRKYVIKMSPNSGNGLSRFPVSSLVLLILSINVVS